MRALLPLVMLFAGCGSGGDKTDTSAADADTDTDADTDSDTDADSDSDTDADTDTDPTFVVLQVNGANAECGYGYGNPSNLSASDAGGGNVDVRHDAFAQGCCPTFSVQARLVFATDIIEASYNTQPDNCDCICDLDATYQIQGVPSGTWTLEAVGDSVQVVVP